jgi:hypothetical protein
MSSKPSFIDTIPGISIASAAISRAARSDQRAYVFDEAMMLMQTGRWQAAFDRLAKLADGGHAQAARLALLFVRRGTSLFGGTFHATSEQRDAWQRISD